MTKSKKGHQGFIKLPTEYKRSKRGVYYLTEGEMSRLKDFCTKLGTTPSVLIRERLNDIIKD